MARREQAIEIAAMDRAKRCDVNWDRLSEVGREAQRRFHAPTIDALLAAGVIPAEGMVEDQVDSEVEDNWREFWMPIVAPNGVVNIQQVKRELFDFSVVMRNVSEVYDELTGGMISKPNTRSSAVIAAHNDYLERCREDNDAIPDAPTGEGVR